MRHFFYIIMFGLAACQSPENHNEQSGESRQSETAHTQYWRAELALNDSIILPFILETTMPEGRLHAFVQNGEERIPLKTASSSKDSIALDFPVYQSRLIARIDNSRMTGYFQKTDSKNYLVPLSAVRDDSIRFKNNDPACCEIPERWKAVFQDGDRTTNTIGEFFQNGNDLNGSFITEFGDYRFLKGKLNGNQFSLYGFDGGYLQVFTAELEDGNLVNGHYYSGLTGYQTWSATPNHDFQLTDPDLIAELNTDALPVHFSYPGIDGNTVSYSPETHQGKVAIIQITGSWCPNCKDQGRYLQELKNKYSASGLDVIGVAFERMGTLEKSIAAAKKSKEDLGTDYPVGIAKYNRDQVAEEEFPFLKKIRSYPTLIILDKQGNVRKIHTGFSGPGTSQYEDLTNSLTQFIEDLLHE